MAEGDYSTGIFFSLLIINANLKWWEHWSCRVGSNDTQRCTEDRSALTQGIWSPSMNWVGGEWWWLVAFRKERNKEYDAKSDGQCDLKGADTLGVGFMLFFVFVRFLEIVINKKDVFLNQKFEFYWRAVRPCQLLVGGMTSRC